MERLSLMSDQLDVSKTERKKLKHQLNTATTQYEQHRMKQKAKIKQLKSQIKSLVCLSFILYEVMCHCEERAPRSGDRYVENIQRHRARSYY